MRAFLIIFLLAVSLPAQAQGLGEVLGWKFDGVPGITTRENVITGWPVSLGTLPTKAQINQWTADFLAAKPGLDAARGVDGLKSFRALMIWLAPLVGKTPAQARSEIIAVYKGLP